MTFLSVFVGGWIGFNIYVNPRLLIAGLAAVLACAFGNIYNDIVDLHIDSKNNPSRPLPSGSVNLTTAKALAVILPIAAVILSIPLGLIPFIIVLIVIMALYLYSKYLKLTPWANITVASIASLSFLFGGIVTKNSYSISIIPLSLTYHFSRELIKDVIDLKWDKVYGSKSIPVIAGPYKAKIISIIGIILFTISLPLPYLIGAVSFLYLYICAAMVPLNIFIIILMLGDRKKLLLSSQLIKLGMLISISGVILGTIL